MEEAVSEQLKQVEMKKEELKQSLDALSAQSSSLLEVSVKMKVLDAYFDSIFKMIEKRVVEVRVRENEVEKMVDEVRVREIELEKMVDEVRVRETELEKNVDEVRVRETELEKRVDEVRVLRGEMCRKERWLEERGNRVLKKEDELDERRKGLRLKQVRVGVLRTVIFDEICKEKMKLNDFEMRIMAREMSVDEMERANEERAMRMEDETSRLAKRFDDRRKEMEWRGKRLENRKKLIDAKVKEMEAKELSLNDESNAFSKRVAEMEMKEKEAHDAKRVVNCLVQELESERDEIKALREQVSLLTQKLKSTAKSINSSVKSTDEENLASQLDLNAVPCTSSAGTTLDGRTLQMYINDMASNDESWQDEVLYVLQKVSEPAEIVLDAMEGFYPPHLPIDEKQFDADTVRKTCICLLESLNSISPSVSLVVREKALKLAFEWKEKMTVTKENPLEVMGFLELVMTYRLTKEFNGFELLNLSTIAFGETTPLKLLQDLGCVDNTSASVRTPDDANSELASTKASNIGYVSNLLSSNQRLQALKYICEFDLEDNFSVNTIVDIYVNNLKQNSRKLLEEKGNTAAEQEAAELEISGLKELIKCIKTYKLEDRYSPASLDERISQIERQFYSKKRAAPSMNFNSSAHPFKKKLMFSTEKKRKNTLKFRDPKDES